MIRKAFVLSVHEGHEAEYERRHRPIWPELEAVLRSHGVHTYSIFLHPGTRQVPSTPPSLVTFRASASGPRCGSDDSNPTSDQVPELM